MLYFPNAKINLGLKITGKRADGFHELSSVFLPVEWCDVLEVHLKEGQKGLELKMLGREIDGEVIENLVYRAYELLDREYGLPGVKATLSKAIPSGAGLGGGSADGAFMLRALNEIGELGLGTEKLEEHAAELGSDCPFFIKNKPALVEGRGEKVAVIEEQMVFLKGYEILIVHPGVHVNTGEAFKMIAGEFTEALDLKNAQDLKGTFSNDFEARVVENNPEIKKVKQFLEATGPCYVQMTGTGSAVFALYKKGAVEGLRLKSEAEQEGWAAYFGAL